MDHEQERFQISDKAKKTVNQFFNTQLFYEELKKLYLVNKLFNFFIKKINKF